MQPSEIEIVDEMSRIFLDEIGESISLRLDKRISKETALVISIAPSPFRRPTAQDLVLLWIKSSGKTQYIKVARKYERIFASNGMAGKTIASQPDFLRFDIDEFIEWMKQSSRKHIFLQMLSDSFCFETFGCCSRYQHCSDSRKCVHPDPMFSYGCQYRQNLLSGRIFYGVNKNI